MYYDNFPKEVRDALKHTNLCVDPIVQCNPKSRKQLIDYITVNFGHDKTLELLKSEQLRKRK
jgi:hypothetical protein